MSNILGENTLYTRRMDIEESEDVISLQRQALEITLPDSHFDPNAMPTTGEEYLTHMAYERGMTPTVITRRPPVKRLAVNNPAEKIKPNYTASIQNDEECAAQGRAFAAKCNSVLATAAWKKSQIKNFKYTRRQVALKRRQLVESPTESSYVRNSYAWLEYCRENPPKLSTILSISQRDLETLLEYIVEWLQCEQKRATEITEESFQEKSTEESDTITTEAAVATENDNGVIMQTTPQIDISTQWLGEWLYAILACLRLPLEPQVHSTLRDVARICVRQRSRLTMPVDKGTLTSYNIFIHLIANIFGQLDFAEFV